MRVQREGNVSWEREVIHRKRIELLLSLDLVRGNPWRRNFLKAVGNKEDQDDQQSICATFDFEVAEKGVRAKEVQSFVDDVCFLWIVYESR